jgi:hypothetical protein
MGGLDVGPKDHAQSPAEVVGQRVLATPGVPTLVTMTSDVVHYPSIRHRSISVVGKMLCRHDDLFSI